MNNNHIGHYDINHYQGVEDVRFFFNTTTYRTPHFHRDIEIIWVLEGGLEIKSGSTLYTVYEGQMIIINSKQQHELLPIGKNCTTLVALVSPDIVDKDIPMFENICFAELYVDVVPEEIYMNIKKMMLKATEVYLKKPEFYQLFCRSSMQLFIYEMMTYLPYRHLSNGEGLETERNSARLNRLIRYVDENYMKNIKLSDFAKQEGRSLTHLSHFIKNTMNCNFREYVDLVRFNAACRMMENYQCKMLDVCVECGFSDYKYFSKSFLKRTGMTPETYNRQLREIDEKKTEFRHEGRSFEKFYSLEESLILIKKFFDRYSGS